MVQIKGDIYFSSILAVYLLAIQLNTGLQTFALIAYGPLGLACVFSTQWSKFKTRVSYVKMKSQQG